MENRVLNPKDMFTEGDIRKLFHCDGEDIAEWEKRGLITPHYVHGKKLYNPSQVAPVASRGRARASMHEFR